MMAKIQKDHFRVAIFGSARIKKDDPHYKHVFSLAKLLAQENIDVVTGGGPGLMDAASRGHHKGRKNNNVHSLGLTIKLPHEQTQGYHLDIQKDFTKFSGRLDKFMQLSNVVIVAPGGIGTMLEFFYTWQLIQVNQICHIPVILLGNMWGKLLTWVKKYPLKENLLSEKDMEPIFVAKSNAHAMKIILKAKKQYENGGKNVCRNIKKYKI
ncbi:LOG family protein [Candidatus Woesearchaeota archaeon]|jgi:uncharacterized protein (TIGR00730 family)|nr:LOG family protein [Candidatus Woesearchaeota archaeon]MBT5924697.1 LOG family protein [Candidatus Woesearchaeota archaeon]MBT6367486.1 LOG family protein [Candidatus Woesearchaeota archaeon]